MKKFFGILLVICLMISLLVGCGTKEAQVANNVDAENTTETVTDDFMSEVIGHYNGTPILRSDVEYNIQSSDVGASFVDFEKNAVKYRAYDMAIAELVKDVAVEDSEIEEQILYYKSVAEGEGMEWNMYLALYIGMTEDALRKEIANDLKEQKYIKSLGEEKGYTEEELKEFYEENKGNLDNLALDVIFFENSETYDKAVEMLNNGKSLEEISEELEIEISPDRHISVDSDMSWNVDLNEAQIGDMAYSLNTSDDITLVVGRIVEKNIGLENESIRANAENNLLMSKGSEEGNARLTEILKSADFDAFGEKISLYSESGN